VLRLRTDDLPAGHAAIDALAAAADASTRR
jgi:hypothetical protein